MSWPVHRFECLESTMSQARSLAANGAPEGTTVLANAQTGGRGRRGRTWISPPGGGVWMTTILRPPPGPGLRGLALVAGLAVWRATRWLAPDAPALLKWPNDVWVHERKLAGILLEADDITGYPVVLVGIGVNLRVAAGEAGLPTDMAVRSIGLADLVEVPLEGAFAAVLEAFQQAYAEWRCRGLEPILLGWQRADALRGREVQAEGPTGPVRGVADGLGPAGELRLRQASGALVLVQAGEVQTLRPIEFFKPVSVDRLNQTDSLAASVDVRESNS